MVVFATYCWPPALMEVIRNGQHTVYLQNTRMSRQRQNLISSDSLLVLHKLYYKEEARCEGEVNFLFGPRTTAGCRSHYPTLTCHCDHEYRTRTRSSRCT